MKAANDRQLLTMLAAMIPNVDLEALDAEKVQAAIRNPKLLAMAITALINNDMRLTFVGTPVIDLDAPLVPKDWELLPDAEQIQSRMTGKWAYDSGRFCDHLDEGQTAGVGYLIGNDLKTKLKGIQVGRAAMADFMYANQAHIPESWKDGKWRCFWGDIFRGPDGGLCVRCLRWSGGQWYLGWGYLDGGFDAGSPAVRAS